MNKAIVIGTNGLAVSDTAERQGTRVCLTPRQQTQHRLTVQIPVFPVDHDREWIV
jgi:hypothetical protein